jgi:hypothetical protein
VSLCVFRAPLQLKYDTVRQMIVQVSVAVTPHLPYSSTTCGSRQIGTLRQNSRTAWQRNGLVLSPRIKHVLSRRRCLKRSSRRKPAQSADEMQHRPVTDITMTSKTIRAGCTRLASGRRFMTTLRQDGSQQGRDTANSSRASTTNGSYRYQWALVYAWLDRRAPPYRQ